MMDDAIAQGREAWLAIKGSHRKSFDLWLLIGYALRAGRTAAMAGAQCKVPHGKRYNRFHGEFLRSNGFEDIQPAARYQIAHIIDNLPKVQAWRETLSEERKIRLNCPESIWHHFLHDTKQTSHKIPKSRRHVHKQAERGDARKINIYFSQDQIRRAATAIRENFCNDTFRLARVALEAAIRSEADILLITPAPPAKKGRPKLAPAALELHP